jgi:hypothetical protein
MQNLVSPIATPLGSIGPLANSCHVVKVFCLQMRHWLVNEELETIEQVGSELEGGTFSTCLAIESRTR